MRRLLTGAAVFCSLSAATAAFGDEPIKVGWPNSFSPPGNVIGAREAKVGGEIALDLFKAQYGAKIAGRDIEIIFEDTKGDPEAARSAMEKLINKDHIDVAAGCNHSSEGFVISRLAHEGKTPVVLMNCWSDDIRKQKFDEVFATSNYTSRTSFAVTGFIKLIKAKSFVILAENTDFGTGQAKMIENDLKKEVPDCQVTIKVINKTARDMRDEMISFKQNAPDVIGVAMTAPQGFLATSQMDEVGLAPTSKTKVIDIGGYTDQQGFWDAVKESGVGQYGYVLDHKAIPVTDLGSKVQAEYKKRTGQLTTKFTLQGFDATWVALMALKDSQAKSKEATIASLRKLRVTGSRAEIYFADEPLWQQWPDIPFVVVKMEKVGQPTSEAKVVFPADLAAK
jgi:ABC-type branched-subunit amino acid transport system substrate-binding protein